VTNDLSHRTDRMLSPGSHDPLGATLAPGGQLLPVLGERGRGVPSALRPARRRTDRYHPRREQGPIRLERRCAAVDPVRTDGDLRDPPEGIHRPHDVMEPPLQGIRWRRAVDTSLPAGEDITDDGSEPLPDPADRYLVNPRTTVVLVGK